jgi:eukaryotic-like serine/threonine-protein kinase
MIGEPSPAALGTAERARLLGGRYQLLTELGRGASGVVYKAHDPKLDRPVAIKILRPELVSLEESGVSLKQRFHQEAVAAGRLTHPAIVSVHDVGEAEGRPFMVMEYIEGGTLADLLLGGQPVPLTDTLDIVVQVCAALDYAHRHGVVHLDIKPRNILVAPGVTKVTDFGTARILGASQTGTMLGTPAYMSPEMVRGQATDPRSDLFSLGVVLYEALTGVNPFNAADLAAVLYRIVNTDARPVRYHHAELPVALDRVLRRALAKEPEARYATATHFAEALREAATGKQRRWSRRALREAWQDLRRIRFLSRPIRVAISAMCLLALVAGTWAGLQRGPDLTRTGVPAPSVKRETEPAARPATPKATALAARPAPAVTARVARPTTQTPTATTARPTTPTITARVASPATATPTTAEVSRVPSTPQESRCLSVNAVPYAEVYVDDRPVGYTPSACLRVAIGEHRIRFQMDGQRSPERLLRITARHTPDAPMRLSYDFNTGRFVEP